MPMLTATAFLFANAAVPTSEDSAPNVGLRVIGDQLFRGRLVHVARLRVGPLLSADAVLVENLGGFFHIDLHHPVQFLRMHVR